MLSVLQRMLLFSWIRRKQSFDRHKEIKHSGGLDIVTIFFFIWMHGLEKLKVVLKDLNKFHPI